MSAVNKSYYPWAKS